MNSGCVPYSVAAPGLRSSSSARKPLQTSRQDSQNYGSSAIYIRAAPTKRKYTPDPDSSGCQRNKKPRLNYDSVKRSTSSDATSPASRIRRPPHEGTFFHISASALQQMLRNGSSLRVGMVKSMHPAMTSPRPSFRYDAVKKTFVIFAHGVMFTLSATDSPWSSFGPALPAFSDGNIQKTDTNVPKDVRDPPATTTYSNQERNPNDRPSIGPIFRPLTNAPQEPTLARFKRASGVSSTLASNSTADPEGVCVANKNVSGGARATPSMERVSNIDITGIMQSTKRPPVTSPRPSKPQAKHSMTSQVSAAQHLHKEVRRNTTAPSFKTALDPNAAASRINMDRSSLMNDIYMSTSQRKHDSRKQFPSVALLPTGNSDSTASLASANDSANTEVARSTAQKDSSFATVSGRVTAQECNPDENPSSHFSFNRDLTPTNPTLSMGTACSTDIAGSSRKMKSASTYLPQTTTSRSDEEDRQSSEGFCTTRRDRNIDDTQSQYHSSPSEYSSDSDEDSDGCEIITKPEGYSWRRPPPETISSRKHHFPADYFDTRLDPDNNGFEADREISDQMTYTKLRGLFLPPLEDPYGIETQSPRSDANQPSMATQNPVRTSSSGIYDDRDSGSYQNSSSYIR